MLSNWETSTVDPYNSTKKKETAYFQVKINTYKNKR